MQSDKQTTYKVLAAVILIALAFWLGKTSSKPQQATDTTQQQPSPQQQLSFSSGEVVRVEGDKIYYANAGLERFVVVGASTKLVKQVPSGDGLGLVEAKLADFKAKSMIIIYPEVTFSGEFTPSKIQIIK